MKKFYCREWVFSKLLHCLQNLEKELSESSSLVTPTSRRSGGIMIVGGAGSGKSALCSEIVEPTGGKQTLLNRSLLAYHFCQANDSDTLSLQDFILRLAQQLSSSPLLPTFAAKLEEESVQEGINLLESDADAAFKQIILIPLLEIPKPSKPYFLLVDSIDETPYGSEREVRSGKERKNSTSIEELLLSNVDLFPPWLVPIFTARRLSKASSLSGFRKIGLDDLRKPQVVRDVQQYILLRIEEDPQLRQHISKETADMLNQLHIKSNGCFLYIEKVLDGVADGFIALPEIRDIPGTLNGLYLWMCQRLFSKKQFTKASRILSVLLASRKPLLQDELFLSLRMRCSELKREEFRRRLLLLSRLLTLLTSGYVLLFHHSFAEWLLDVKYCTPKFLCSATEGHHCLSLLFSHLAPHLQEKGVVELEHHLTSGQLIPSHLHSLLLLSAACNLGVVGERRRTGLIGECLPEESPVVNGSSGGAELEGEEGGGGVELVEEEEEDVNSIKNEKEEDEEDEEGGVVSLYEDGGEGLCELSVPTTTTDELLHLDTHLNTPEEEEEGGGGGGGGGLLEAAIIGRTEVVRRVVREGSLEGRDRSGRTALHLAAREGHEEIVSMLLESNCEVDAIDKDGWTPLCLAASQGHLKIVNLLLEANASVNHRDRDSATPLLIAAFEGHQKVCETLLEYEAEIDCCDKVGRNPLWAAASMGYCNVAELLLFWGVYVDHIDGDGRTVLSVAAAQGNVGVVKLLLARGLDEGHRDNLGWTPLHYGAFEGHHEVVEALIEAGARVNDVDNDGYHALLLAAQEGHFQVIRSLLNYDADIDHRSHDGQTALRVAATEGFKDIVQVLVKEGANVNYCDMDGRSTLYLLALENRVKMAQFLILCGADVEARDFEGRTPLHVSSWQGHMKMVELLLSAGALVDSLDNDNRTPLQSAAWEGHDNILRLLSDRGAAVDHMCNQGATALCISVQCGHIECVKVLLEYGANAKHSDRSGRTPIKVALKSGHFSISRLLEEAIRKPGGEKLEVCEGTGNRSRFEQGGAEEYEDDLGKLEMSSVSPHSPLLPPITSPKIVDNQTYSTPGSVNHERINLYFANQVHELSKKGERRKVFNSPIYSSPPLSPPKAPPHLLPESNRNGLSKPTPLHTFLCPPEERKTEEKTRLTISSSPFAFTRDSHMKIILGSSSGGESSSKPLGRSSKKSGGSGPNGSISTATSAIRSGLSAIRAGVIEAATGKRFIGSSQDSPLVSAASLAVPNAVLQNNRQKGFSSGFLKKETQL